MQSRVCLRTALTMCGLLAGWQSLTATAEAGLFGLLHGCRSAECCETPVCEVYSCAAPCESTCIDEGCCTEVVCGGECYVGRCRRRCRAPRRLRRCGAMTCGYGCDPCAMSCGAPVGCCECCPSPCHCGRRAARRAHRAMRRCVRQCNRMNRRACRAACSYCEPCGTTCDSGCSPCHAGCGRRLRMRGCGRVRCRCAACCVDACCVQPMHGGCGSMGGCGRLRGRRRCHYCCNSSAGYGCCQGGSSCDATMNCHSSPPADLPSHDAQPIQPQPSPTPADAPPPLPQDLPAPANATLFRSLR